MANILQTLAGLSMFGPAAWQHELTKTELQKRKLALQAQERAFENEEFATNLNRLMSALEGLSNTPVEPRTAPVRSAFAAVGEIAARNLKLNIGDITAVAPDEAAAMKAKISEAYNMAKMGVPPSAISKVFPDLFQRTGTSQTVKPEQPGQPPYRTSGEAPVLPINTPLFRPSQAKTQAEEAIARVMGPKQPWFANQPQQPAWAAALDITSAPRPALPRTFVQNPAAPLTENMLAQYQRRQEASALIDPATRLVSGMSAQGVPLEQQAGPLGALGKIAGGDVSALPELGYESPYTEARIQKMNADSVYRAVQAANIPEKQKAEIQKLIADIEYKKAMVDVARDRIKLGYLNAANRKAYNDAMIALRQATLQVMERLGQGKIAASVADSIRDYIVGISGLYLQSELFSGESDEGLQGLSAGIGQALGIGQPGGNIFSGLAGGVGMPQPGGMFQPWQFGGFGVPQAGAVAPPAAVPGGNVYSIPGYGNVSVTHGLDEAQAEKAARRLAGNLGVTVSDLSGWRKRQFPWTLIYQLLLDAEQASINAKRSKGSRK